MKKLLNKAMTSPTPENKAKLLAYVAKHPMSLCLATPTDITIIEQYRREAA